MSAPAGAARPRPLALLTQYKAWADARLYAALAGLAASQLSAPTPVFAGSLLRTLHHVYLIDAVWKAHLLGVPHGYTTRNPESSPPFADLCTRQAQMDAWFADYANALDSTRRDETVRFRFIGGGDGAMTRREIIAHVVNHTTYHRGHMTAMLWMLGVPPPTTDLPVFMRERAADPAGL